MKFSFSILLNLLLLFALIWSYWPIFHKRYPQDGVWQLADPKAFGPDGAKAVLQIEDGLVVAMHDGCAIAGTDRHLRSPYWIRDAMECLPKPIMSFMDTIHPFSGVDYDAVHDVVFVPNQGYGRKFIRKKSD